MNTRYIQFELHPVNNYIVQISLPNQNRQRVGFLTCVPALLRRFGVDPAEVLPRVGLELSALDSPEATIAYADMGRLMATAASATQCPHFGLEVGAQITTATLGALGKQMRNAVTLRSALKDFAANQHRNAHGGVVYLLKKGDQALSGYAVYQPAMPGHGVISDAAAMGIFSVLRELVEIRQVPQLAVLLARSEPSNAGFYRDTFGVKLIFNAEQTAVAFPREWLDSPVPGAQAQVRRDLQAEAESNSPAGELDLETDLRRRVRVNLLTGDLSATNCAAQIGLTRWTLDRRLLALGTSFQNILDETRCDFTQQLLANTRLQISEIATIVAYADPSTLTRSFIRWTGLTPSAWRENLLQESSSGTVA